MTWGPRCQRCTPSDTVDGRWPVTGPLDRPARPCPSLRVCLSRCPPKAVAVRGGGGRACNRRP